MALTQEEREIVEAGIAAGKNKQQVFAALANYRDSVTENAPKGGYLSNIKIPLPALSGGNPIETAGDLKETFEGVGGEFAKAGEEIVETVQRPNINPFEKVVQIGGQAFRGGTRAFGELITGGAKTAVPEAVEQGVGETLTGVGEEVAKQPVVQDLIQRYKALPEDKKRNVDAALGYAEGLAEILTAGAAGRVINPTLKILERGTSAFLRESDRLFPTSQTFGTVEDLIEQTSKRVEFDPLTPAGVRQAAEEAAPNISLLDRWAGIQPDIKKRIQGKQDQLREYFDVAHARNVDDTLPTPYEYGAARVESVVDKMDDLLQETGGQIGATRQKLGTIRASVDALARIEDTFRAELDKLNLELTGTGIRQKSGKILKVGSNTDINALQELWDEFLIVKQNPSLENLIDFRSLWDARINFGKRASEVSNSVDPVARQVRRSIADEAASIVGKTEAQKLQQYSEFMDALNELRSYTERKAGGEYLLRLVLSGRGGEARRLIQTVKEYTGVDLMDDATMMTLATDMIGNSNQKNLFRQELAKSGLDAARVLSGDPTGLLGILMKNIPFDRLREEAFLKAAQ